MYSKTNKPSRYKTFIVAVLIVTMLVFAPPKRTDAFIIGIIGLIAGATATSLILDLIIYCALGIICGGGGGGGGGGSCDDTVGDPCSIANSCGSVSSDPNDLGTIQADCSCDAVPTPDYVYNDCESAANYCGMKNIGDTYCDGTCTATTPPASACIDPLDDDSLIITPPVVRIGDTVTVTVDIGTNFPSNCVLSGTGVTPTNPYRLSDTDTDPSRIITVTGPHLYKLECGAGNAVQKTVIVLPTIYES